MSTWTEGPSTVGKKNPSGSELEILVAGNQPEHTENDLYGALMMSALNPLRSIERDKSPDLLL